MKKGLEEKEIILIDVRNPDEVASMGKIPGKLSKCLSGPYSQNFIFFLT